MFFWSAFIISSTSLRRTLRGLIISSALFAAHLYLILGSSPQRFQVTAKETSVLFSHVWWGSLRSPLALYFINIELARLAFVRKATTKKSGNKICCRSGKFFNK